MLMSSERYEKHWKDYYQVVGVHYNDSPMTIRRAWHQLSYYYHQDVGCNAQVNLARVQELNEAYEVLSDPFRRARYELAYQSRAKEPSTPSPGTPTGDVAPPPTSQGPPPEDPRPVRTDGRGGLVYLAKLIAAAGAMTVLTLILAGVIAAFQPTSFNRRTPAPLPDPALTPHPAAMPLAGPTVGGTTDPSQVSPDPTPTPALAPRNPILVMSPEAEALGFRGFQVGGNPWMVDFSAECQEAPCLRSGVILGAGISTLLLNLEDLPASVGSISFDFKAASQACCSSFKIIMSPIAGLQPVTADLPDSNSWTRVEVEVPSVRPRPIAVEWEFWTPSGVGRLDGIWVDNIQFK